MVQKRRGNDGVTVGKLAVSALAVCGSLLTYIYISNQNEDRGYMKSIAGNVEKISVNQIISYEHQKNMQAMIIRNEKKIDGLHNEAKRYWRPQ